MKSPCLAYPDQYKAYTLFKDTSKYAWLTVLTQEHASVIDSKTIKHQHPITYSSGLSRLVN